MAYKTFISHSGSDRWVAEQVKRCVVECGSDTFVDVYDIEKGDDFEERIFDELRSCAEIVVLLTPWSVDRNWVWVEVGAARALGLRIVAVMYEISLDSLDAEKGGSTILKVRNTVEINELDTYFRQLKKRVSARKTG